MAKAIKINREFDEYVISIWSEDGSVFHRKMKIKAGLEKKAKKDVFIDLANDIIRDFVNKRINPTS